MKKKSYNAFFAALGERESKGSGCRDGKSGYACENRYHFIGKYQMGEGSLIETGYYLRRGSNTDKTTTNDWTGQWTGKDGVHSKHDFLTNHQAQENAVQEYTAQNWAFIKRHHLDDYVGKKINGEIITTSGLLAGCHLDRGKTAHFLRSQGRIDSSDALGTEVSSYIYGFSGYEMPFVPTHSHKHSSLEDNHIAAPAEGVMGGTGTDQLVDSSAPDMQSLIRTTVEEFGIFTREQQQNFMMELNGWGIQFDSPTINAYLRDKLLAERFPELPEDGRAHIIDQVRQLEAEDGEKFSTRELTEYAQYELNRHLIREEFPAMPEDGVQHIIDQVRQMEREDGTVFPRDDMFAYAAYELEKHQQSVTERIETERAELLSLYQQRDEYTWREALEREYLEAQMEVRALQQQQEIQRYQEEIAEVQWQQQQVQQREEALERMRNLEVELAQIRQEEVGYLTTEYEKTQAQVERLENKQEDAYSGSYYWQEMVSNDNSGGRMDEGRSWVEREAAREESRDASGGFGIGYGSSGPSYGGDGCYGGGPSGDGGGYGAGGDGGGGGDS